MVSLCCGVVLKLVCCSAFALSSDQVNGKVSNNGLFDAMIEEWQFLGHRQVVGQACTAS